MLVTTDLNKSIISSLSILVFTLYSCKKTEPFYSSTIKSALPQVIKIDDPSGLKNIQSKKIRDYIDTTFFIKLRSKNNKYIGEIDKILVVSDTIFISDKITDSIFIYDFQGNLINIK